MRLRLVPMVFLTLISSVALAEATHSFAAGLGAGWRVRQDYGSRTLHQLLPEAVFLGYVPLSGPLWLRPEARVGYAMQQPDMPSALRIEEHDTTLSAGVGVLWNWYVVPSVSLSYMHIFRKIRLVTGSGIRASAAHVTGLESLEAAHVQVGVGLPAVEGFVVLEPWIRHTICPKDKRLGIGYGVDVTFGIF